MKLLPTLALVLTTALAAHADVVIEQKVESAMLNGNMVLKIRADKARMDMPSLGGQMTVIWDFNAGQMTTLMTAQKMAMKGSIQPKQNAAGQPQPKPTGVTEKVGPYTAEVYEVTSGPTTQKIWVAKDYPNADLIKAEMRKMSGATPMGFGTTNLDMPGMMVKMQMASPAGPVTVTVVSARQQAVPDSDFVIPPGYKEMGMGGLAAGASPTGPSPATGAAPVAPTPPANATPIASNPPAAAAPSQATVPAKARRHWEGRFKELDTNGDGRLSLAEFLAGPMGKKTPEKAKTFFKSIDKNNTGSVTMDQFVVAEAEREGETEPAQPAATTAAPTPTSEFRSVGPASPLVIVTGVAVESSDKGALIKTARGSLVWLTGTSVRAGFTVEISAVKTEPHTYTATNGKQQTIDGYRASLTGR